LLHPLNPAFSSALLRNRGAGPIGLSFESLMLERTAIFVFLSLPVFLGPATTVSLADYIALKGGGEIRGELLPEQKATARSDAATIDSISIRMLSGATVAVARVEIDAVVRRRPIAEEYETRRRVAPATIVGQWEASEWCRQKSLPQERRFHLRQVVLLDPEHEAAHRGLGHIRDRGQWTTRNEMLESQGYVQHKGKRVLPQELELTQEREQLRQTERNWFKRVKQWQVWLDSERNERKSEAVKGLNAIREADAIPALVLAFRNAPEEERRLLLVRILSKIEGDRPIPALVVQSVLDDARSVRDAAINAVHQKNPATAVPIYLKALKSQLNPAVNRAATALGQLADESAIPFLIDALITKHGYHVAPNHDGHMPGSGQGIGFPVVLGPSVGVKSSAGDSTAFSANRAPSADQPYDEVVEVELSQENPDVLAALNLLTSQNFGYHTDSWRSWYHSHRPGTGKKRASKSP
jgi:hypothetical protein